MEQPSTSSFSCPLCDLDFSDNNLFLKHFKVAHPGATPNSNPNKSAPEFRCIHCNKTFTRRFGLTEHINKRRCKELYGRGKKRKHLANPSSSQSKRFRWGEEQEDEGRCPNVFLDPDQQKIYRQNWTAIRSHSRQGQNQLFVNLRWRDQNPPNWHERLNTVFEQQTRSFKINFSHSFILFNKEQGEYRFFHACQNNTRALDFPFLVCNKDDFERFIKEELDRQDILEFARTHRPDSKWTVFCVVSTSFYINPINNVPIGCCDSSLPDTLKNNSHVYSLVSNPHTGAPYTDNLCFFRCLALHRGAKVESLEKETKTLAKGWVRVPNAFQGVLLTDLDQLEQVFQVDINVYEVEEETEFFIPRRRSKLTNKSNIMNVLLYDNHFCYISNLRLATRSFICAQCGHVGTRDHYMKLHEAKCEGLYVKNTYPGGVYHTQRNVWQILQQNGIKVPQNFIYPFFSTYDFEALFSDLKPGEKNQTDQTTYLCKHDPMSVSVSSNIPGFEKEACFVSDDQNKPQNLVNPMMTYLKQMSDHAFELLQGEFRDVYQEISELDPDPVLEFPPQKLKKLLDDYLHELPVVGFNSSVYDINLIKTAFFENLIVTDPDYEDAGSEEGEGGDSEDEESLGGDPEDEESLGGDPEGGDGDNKDETKPQHKKTKKKSAIKFIIKNNNEYKCIATRRLKFLDIKNYIAPGFSYEKYLAAFEIEQKKGFFPYEYITSLDTLKETQLPPIEAFYSSLKKSLFPKKSISFVRRFGKEKK